MTGSIEEIAASVTADQARADLEELLTLVETTWPEAAQDMITAGHTAAMTDTLDGPSVDRCLIGHMIRRMPEWDGGYAEYFEDFRPNHDADQGMRPIEKFILPTRPHGGGESARIAALIAHWIDEWLTAHGYKEV